MMIMLKQTTQFCLDSFHGTMDVKSYPTGPPGQPEFIENSDTSVQPEKELG
jgi:hypothetical protein